MSNIDSKQKAALLSYLEEKTDFKNDYLFVRDNAGEYVDLGEGATGNVYLAKSSQTGVEYAVKVICFNSQNEEGRIDDLKKISDIISKIGPLANECNNIVRINQFYKYSVGFNEDYSVKECKRINDDYEKDGNLKYCLIFMEKLNPIIEYVANSKRNCTVEKLLVSRKEVLKLARQVGSAISVAHQHDIVHRDIKLENILISPIDGTYKIGDYGTVTKVKETGTARTYTGTDGMMAPEVANGEYNAKTADIYSFGMTIYLLLNNLEGDKRRVTENDILAEPVNGWDEINKIVMKALEYHHQNRYQSIQEMLNDLDELVINDDVLQKRDDAGSITEGEENADTIESGDQPKVSILPSDESKIKVSVLPKDSDKKMAEEEPVKELRHKEDKSRDYEPEQSVSGDKYFVESYMDSEDTTVESEDTTVESEYLGKKKIGKIEKIRRALRIPALFGLIFAVVQNVSRIDFSIHNEFTGIWFILATIAGAFVSIRFLIKNRPALVTFLLDVLCGAMGVGISVYGVYGFFNYHSHLYFAMTLMTIASLCMKNWAMELTITIGMLLAVIAESYSIDISFLNISGIDWLIFAVAFVSFWAVLKHYSDPHALYIDFIGLIQLFLSGVLFIAGIVIVILSKTSWVQVSNELASIRVYIAAIISAVVALIGFMDYE